MPAWGASIFPVSYTSRSGSYSIAFESASPSDYLLSDFIPVSGADVTSPFNIELVWKNSGAASYPDDTPQVDVLWYNSAKSLVATTNVVYGTDVAGFKPSGGPTTTIDWLVARAQGIQPPSTSSRFVRLKISIPNSDDLTFIDSISMYSCARAMRAGKDNTTYGYMTLGSSWYNVAMGVVDSDPFYDRGSQLDINTSSSIPYTGYHFLCSNAGTYHFSVNASLSHVFGASLATKTITARIIKNATYDINGVWLSTGSIISESPPLVKSWSSVTNGLMMEGTVDLVEGDTLSFNTNWSSGGSGNIVVGAGGGAITESYFLVRQHISD